MGESASRPSNTSAAAVAAAPEAGLWRRIGRAFRHVFRSEVGGTFRLLLGVMLGLLLGINALNVVNSYVGRDLMTAVERHDMAMFVSNAGAWLLVFAGLTVTGVILRFCEERLALLWRDWLTRSLLRRYLEGGAYLRLKERGDLGNPDQRITDDVRAFTATTLSFTLMLVNATLVVIAFSGVLWSISPSLFVLAVVYALLGSVLTVVLGRPLVRLNYDQSDREASFRAELVHAGENAESVALLKLEGRLGARLTSRLAALVLNMKRIVRVNRSVGFFATGYGYGIQLLPPLIVGPLFMKGRVEFGVVTQSAMAFSQLLGAFSLIVNQFGSISSYAASLARLGTFSTALDAPPVPTEDRAPRDHQRERLVFDDLTVYSRIGDDCLVAHLDLSVEAGTRLLVTGTEEARRALFRTAALGPSVAGSGRVLFPGPERVLFLPERPYVPPSTLRELIVRTGQERAVHDEAIASVLGDLELEAALRRVGGLDIERDFSHLLSLGEQQLLGVARVILAAPAFVVLHNPGTTLAPEQLELALARLNDACITYLTLGGLDVPLDAYDAVLELHAGGAWGFRRDSKLPSRPRSEPVHSR